MGCALDTAWNEGCAMEMVMVVVSPVDTSLAGGRGGGPAAD